jgi:crotonobetainyl-CoA:carnitine CoA-transferase CaiB-like acyl-CoA transferase
VQTGSEFLLGPCRVLDLTDYRGFLCGRILGDFGADVIKIEPPSGDPIRYEENPIHDIPDGLRRMYWDAYNANKRGITLDLASAAGVDLFRRLLETTDIVVESFPPGRLDGMGLGYPDLSRAYPGIVMVSITPFGQSGPWRDHHESDLVLWALSSYMYVTGDDDRPPVRISLPQSHLHAGLEAAASAMVALYHRQLTGEGQRVDVSAHQALAVVSLQNQQYWNLAGFVPRRAGASQSLSGVRWAQQRRLWPCKDGFIAFVLFSGHLGAPGNHALTQWMDREGLAPQCMKRIDWNTFDPQGIELSEKEYLQIAEALALFFRRHTKAELYERAVRDRIILCPCSTAGDIVEDAHLGARGIWTQVSQPDIGRSLPFPQPCMRFSEADCGIRRRAPLIGEHNEEIYCGEMGLSRDELRSLTQRGVV